MDSRRYYQVPSRSVPQLIQAGAAIIDVRRPEEWLSTGVVAEAVRLTFFDSAGGSEPLTWLDSLKSVIAPGQDLVLICRSGRRTALICEFLLEVTTGCRLYNVSDGMLGWLAAGLPVAKIVP